MKILGLILLAIGTILSTCFAISTMWGWFVVPLGVVPLSMAHAYGLSALVAYMSGTYSVLARMNNKDEDNYEVMTKQFILPWVVLGFGYLTTLFM